MGLYAVIDQPQEPRRALEYLRLYAADPQLFVAAIRPFLTAVRHQYSGECDIEGVYEKTDSFHHVDLKLQAVRVNEVGAVIRSSTVTLHLQINEDERISHVSY